jgi:hypothetical protein
VGGRGTRKAAQTVSRLANLDAVDGQITDALTTVNHQAARLLGTARRAREPLPWTHGPRRPRSPTRRVVILPERGADDRHLDPRAWVDAIRRPAPRRLRQRVVDYLAKARELGEV